MNNKHKVEFPKYNRNNNLFNNRFHLKKKLQKIFFKKVVEIYIHKVKFNHNLMNLNFHRNQKVKMKNQKI